MTLSVAWLGPPVEAALLCGLIARGRARAARALAVLVTALLASDALILVLPQINTWGFWIGKELVHVGLFAWLGVETAAKASDEAPTKRAVRRWSTFVAVVTLMLILPAHAGSPVVDVLPLLMGGLAWLYTGLAVVMLRYDVRVTPLQDAVLAGFTPYLIVYAATWSRAAVDTSVANLVNPVMFLAVLAIIARAAWLRDDERRQPWLRRSRTQPVTRLANRSRPDRRASLNPPGRANATDARVTMRHIER